MLKNLFYGADEFEAALLFGKMMQTCDSIPMVIEEAVLKVAISDHPFECQDQKLQF
jgi:hypothetical protein